MQIEMSIKGLMIDPITNMPIIVLRDGEGQRLLPIWVGVFEANAIALQIENVQTPRPMTHDLLKNVITDLAATVDRIVVCVGQFFSRYNLVVSGQIIPNDHGFVGVPQYLPYIPTTVEYLLVIAGMGIVGFGFIIGERFLDTTFTTENVH
jgi:hypothetical protein